MGLETNHEVRLQWLRAVRQFKYGIAVRARLGLLQTYCDKAGAQRRSGTWAAPHWKNRIWITLLSDSIKNNEYPEKLLLGFAQTADMSMPDLCPSVGGTVLEVDKVIRAHSEALRRHFGVFD